MGDAPALEVFFLCYQTGVVSTLRDVQVRNCEEAKSAKCEVRVRSASTLSVRSRELLELGFLRVQNFRVDEQAFCKPHDRVI